MAEAEDAIFGHADEGNTLSMTWQWTRRTWFLDEFIELQYQPMAISSQISFQKTEVNFYLAKHFFF